MNRVAVAGRRKARKIRYHDEEWERIVAHARACGMPPATFVRRVPLGANPRPRRYRTENKLILPLGQIVAELRRLARIAERADDVRATEALRQTLRETLDAIRRIG